MKAEGKRLKVHGERKGSSSVERLLEAPSR